MCPCIGQACEIRAFRVAQVINIASINTELSEPCEYLLNLDQLSGMIDVCLPPTLPGEIGFSFKSTHISNNELLIH